ncbi:hypothetical protein AVEN_205817-1 [Araneus ventricosus]|uniref:Transposase Tc1-like domain-containing protein n=1 Tax=Araneus ventricosus TaxID=182803 RepID=A0A4Y2WC51_ARAVE|nr:hypothetical protein AVEN_205817-1 [Araneus ventricosus]
MCQTPEDTNRSNTNWRRSSLLLQEGPCPAKLCRADCIKEDCSHNDLLFVPLSPAHVRARLHWAREHRSWTPEQWGHVLFTDESRFNITERFPKDNDMARARDTLSGAK